MLRFENLFIFSALFRVFVMLLVLQQSVSDTLVANNQRMEYFINKFTFF